MVDSHKPETSVAHLELSTAKGVEDLKSLFLSHLSHVLLKLLKLLAV